MTASLLESLPDGLLLVSNGCVDFANKAARALFGGAETEMQGRSLEDLLGTGAVERLHRKLESHIREDSGYCSMRLGLRRLDDKGSVLVDCRAARLCAHDGGRSGGLVILLTEAKDLARAEKLITSLADLASADVGFSGLDGIVKAAIPMFESLGWWAALLRTSPSGVEISHLLSSRKPTEHPIVAFASGVKEMGALPWSQYPVVRRVYESREPLFLDDVANYLAGVDGFAPQLIESLRAEGFARGAWVPVHSGGETSHVLLVVGPDLTEHDLAGMQLFAAKIAASRRLEDLRNELVRRERLAAVGEMAGVLAHEVRNPLAVIFNAVAGLRRLVGGDDRENLLGIIHEEADRLKRLVGDLVDFARPSVPEMRAIILRDVLERSLKKACSEPWQEAVPVSLDVPPDLPRVDADPHLLQRALLKVLDNAYHAVAEGGAIQISCARDEADWVKLCVRNDGEPLSEEQLRKAFRPFFTTRATGTGLGLTVVRQVVEDLGGKATIECDEGGVALVIRLRVSPPDMAGMEVGI